MNHLPAHYSTGSGSGLRTDHTLIYYLWHYSYSIAALSSELIWLGIHWRNDVAHMWGIWRGIYSEVHQCLQCLCSRDSKDDAKGQAEKDLEEIKKIVEDSGGKLSNRSLQCEVRVQDQIGWIMYYCTSLKCEIIHWGCQITVDEGSLFFGAVFYEQLEFERRKSDGSTTLGILNPADLSAGGLWQWEFKKTSKC